MTETDPQAELREHPGWWVRLSGEVLDLDTLASEIRLDGIRVEQIGDHHYLRVEEWEVAAEDAENVDLRAREILRILNGAVKLAYPDSREVSAEAVLFVGDGGVLRHYFDAGAGTIRLRGHSIGVSTDPPLPVVTQATEIALRDANAERALRIIGRAGVDYRDLYYVFEIAEDALGGTMFNDGSVTRAEVRRFSRTAHSPSALGDAARHGREQTKPPKKPMPFAEAQALVHRILRMWLLK